MKLLIIGSRSIETFDLSDYVTKDTELIITGGASGMDSLAEKFADQHKISKLVLRPQYHIYKKAAPLKRNEKMVDLADEILVIWDGKSKGTEYTIKYAQKRNKIT
ncbi:MAG: hypothetical protein IJ489_07205 [Clostridia bacterium]|nr:hypothetical protein [Clostridia bacterium]